MSYISSEEVDMIRSKVNIVDIVGNYISLTKKGRNYVCVCPFHDDHSPSMSVSFEKQIYKCFSCNAAGNVFTFVQNYENIPFHEAVRLVAESAGISLSESFKESIPQRNKVEFEIMELTKKFFQNNLKTEFGKEALNYLKERGINDEIISRFGIGLALDGYDGLFKVLQKKNYSVNLIAELGLINVGSNYITDVFAKRVMFPLCDKDGNVVAFSGRIYQNEPVAKYVNSKETKIFKKGELLYNYHNAKADAKKAGYIIVVEGYMDAIRLSSCGITNVVALMGTSMTNSQINLLKKLRVKVYLCLDNDDAGINAAIKNGDLLIKENVEVNILKLSEAKDPDEYILKHGIRKFEENLKSPLKYLDFKFSIMRQNKDLTNIEELSKYINEVINNLNSVDDDVLKEVTLGKISKDYGVSLSFLKDKIKSKPIIKTVKKADKPRKRISAYEIAAEKILYFMMNDVKYIKMYNSKLGYFDELKYRELASEIVYYYEKHKDITLADFISYASQKESLNDLVTSIVGKCNEEELNETAMEQYIEAAEKSMIHNEIKKLKEELKRELDINKKIEITTRITELKKGV